MPRALLSVSDKTGVVELARRLRGAGLDIVSTGGTLETLRQAGIDATAVSDLTGFPEIMEGRVKTLHPAIHGGILARRDSAGDVAALQEHGIQPIDLVAVNLYPFGRVVSSGDASLSDALENIDIGGPALIRAAGKNFPSVVVLVDPKDYDRIADQVEAGGLEAISQGTRKGLAAKAFAHVSSYDAVIAQYLRTDDSFPERMVIAGDKLGDLRYGENPHQGAAIYRQLSAAAPSGIPLWRRLSGPEMSYNNYLDANAAVRASFAFEHPTCAIIKHSNPCGIASNASLGAAYEAALASDPVSAYGGVVSFNRPLDDATATLVAAHHYDIVIAPGFSPEAAGRLARKKNLRLVDIGTTGAAVTGERQIRQLAGAFLVQERDRLEPRPEEWQVVSRRAPTEDEMRALLFAWRAVRLVQSNAIVLAKLDATVGIGGGQPNRVDAVRVAVARAGARSRGSVMASDAFFPFADGVEVAQAAGVTAIAEPGGSRRDPEVIAAADTAGMAMVFTGVRHFRH